MIKVKKFLAREFLFLAFCALGSLGAFVYFMTTSDGHDFMSSTRNVIIGLVIIFFPVRYIFYGLLWSFKTLRSTDSNQTQ